MFVSGAKLFHGVSSVIFPISFAILKRSVPGKGVVMKKVALSRSRLVAKSMVFLIDVSVSPTFQT